MAISACGHMYELNCDCHHSIMKLSWSLKVEHTPRKFDCHNLYEFLDAHTFINAPKFSLMCSFNWFLEYQWMCSKYTLELLVVMSQTV